MWGRPGAECAWATIAHRPPDPREPLDPTILARLLAPAFLAKQMAPHLALQGATLRSATPREIEAPGYLSDLTGVVLDWSDSVAAAPARAVLKVSHPGFGQPELPFYETMAARLASPVIPRFYAGGVDEPTGRTWLLMEDLSESHQRPSEAPLPPTLERNVQIVEALAQFHAAGRNVSQAPGTGGTTLWDRLRASDWQDGAWQRLQAQAGDALDERMRHMYTRLLSGFPALLERADQLAQRTLVHGDAHVWNWMVPRDDNAGVAKLIDWDGWHLGVGVWDLSYMMAVQWDRRVRARFEMPLLDRYHSALVAAGVSDYPREAMQQDYRLAVLLHLRTPLARFARGMSAYVWWPQIGRVTDAVEDLGCMDLLG